MVGAVIGGGGAVGGGEEQDKLGAWQQNKLDACAAQRDGEAMRMLLAAVLAAMRFAASSSAAVVLVAVARSRTNLRGLGAEQTWCL